MIPYWLRYTHWRYMIRYKFVGLFQRAWRGYADHDVWGFDHYLASVIAPALRQMAERTNGYPPFILEHHPELLDEDGTVNDDKAMEAWQCWLKEKASWFEWYHREELNLSPNMTDDQKYAALNLYERQHKNFQEKVLVDFGMHYESLWD